MSPRRVRGPWGGGKASMHGEPWAPQDLLGGGLLLFTVGISEKLENIHYRHQKL